MESRKQITLAISAAIEYVQKFAQSHLSHLLVGELLAAQGFWAQPGKSETDEGRARISNALEAARVYITDRDQIPLLKDLVLAELSKAKDAV
jgi:hypothetical protein